MNDKDTGYRGIWYMNQPSGDEYVFKYSGGLGTYCAKHQPLAVYCEEVDKTFFCWGGTSKNSHLRHGTEHLKGGGFERAGKGFLLHMVSFYDHAAGAVPRPTILLDKETPDAHDNPVISVDGDGRIWIFSTSHGTSRPSCIHRTVKPYDISEFEPVPATRLDGGMKVPINNFSYMQPWHRPGRGFAAFFTRYHYPAERTICFMSSPDGVEWSEWTRLAAMGKGHYQVSAAGRDRAGSAFNYHPDPGGLNWRTNLYYVETPDFGQSWRAADGTPLEVPLTRIESPALVHDYVAEGLNVYMKDINYDADDRPIILYLTSNGYEAGPANGPRTWTTARWTGRTWDIRPLTTSDSNYDMGSLYIEDDGTWRVIAPTGDGPQPGNPGGEMAMWVSRDLGSTWKKAAQLTSDSERNHTYARRPVNAHPEFYAFWADGHGREPSKSLLYFCSRDGDVYALPEEMKKESERPLR